MGDAQAFIDDYLAHYASQYYDPAKAHEYYLRTRELAGRRSGSGLKTERKKQAWAYAQNQIKEAEKSDLDAVARDKQAAVENARNRAAMLRASVSQKLTALFEQFSRGLQAERVEIAQARKIKQDQIVKERAQRLEKISAKRKEQLEKAVKERTDQRKKIAEEAAKKMLTLPTVPKGASEEQRAKIMFRRQKKMEAIGRSVERSNITVNQKFESARANANKQYTLARDDVKTWFDGEREAVAKMTEARRTNVSEQVKGMKEEERGKSNAEREAVAQELKGAISGARDNYERLKGEIKAKYESARDTEYEAIRRSA